MFHTTSFKALRSILSEGKLRAHGNPAFVSLSEKVLVQGDISGNDLSIQFADRLGASLLKVQYTESWVRAHPEHAAYIAGEGWREQFEAPDCVEEDGEEDRECYEQSYADAETEAFLFKEKEREWVTKAEGKDLSFQPKDVIAIVVFKEADVQKVRGILPDGSDLPVVVLGHVIKPGAVTASLSAKSLDRQLFREVSRTGGAKMRASLGHRILPAKTATPTVLFGQTKDPGEPMAKTTLSAKKPNFPLSESAKAFADEVATLASNNYGAADDPKSAEVNVKKAIRDLAKQKAQEVLDAFDDKDIKHIVENDVLVDDPDPYDKDPPDPAVEKTLKEFVKSRFGSSWASVATIHPAVDVGIRGAGKSDWSLAIEGSDADENQTIIMLNKALAKHNKVAEPVDGVLLLITDDV